MSDGAASSFGAGGGPGIDATNPGAGGGGGAAPDALSPSTYIFDTKTATPVNLAWLGFNSTVVPGKTSDAYSSFINEHGVWLKYDSGQEVNNDYPESFTLQYTVNVPHTGYYSFVFGASNWALVYINGQDFYNVYDGEAWIRDAYMRYGPNTIYISTSVQTFNVQPTVPASVALMIGYQAGFNGGQGGDGYVSIQWD